jgi:RNA polymerase sigma factor (sigma-70 family)
MTAPPAAVDEDARLLAAFQADQSHDAFRKLVDRYLPLVWSVARRVLVSCPALVEDAAQIVFADLARRAPRLRADAPLGGWLHRHAWFTASKLLRGELRRIARETHAAAMNAAKSSSEATNSSEAWLELVPELDTALASLTAADREAVVQRFFEQRNFKQVGQALGVGEEAARKRVDRAVEKLRVRLRRRGVVSPTAAMLASALAAGHTVAAPPAGAVAGVSAAAWAKHTAKAATTAEVMARWLVLLRHSPWSAPVAGASLVAFALAVWWASAFGARPNHAAHGAATPKAPPALSRAGDPLRAEVVIFNVDDAFARTGVRQRDADGNDAALFQQLMAGAAPPPDLTKLIPAGTQPALAPVVKAAALGGPCRSGREASLIEMHQFKYPTEFEPPERDQPEVMPTHFETRDVGTKIILTASAAHRGTRQVDISFTHHFAPPAMRLWSVQVREDGTSSDVGAEQPDFQLVSGETTVMAPPAEPVLAASLRLPPPLVAGDSPPAPRRLLVFVMIHEEKISAR